jgi:hypothetical protein
MLARRAQTRFDGFDFNVGVAVVAKDWRGCGASDAGHNHSLKSPLFLNASGQASEPSTRPALWEMLSVGGLTCTMQAFYVVEGLFFAIHSRIVTGAFTRSGAK